MVLDPPSALPEGAEVRIEIVPAEAEGPLLDEQGQTLGQKLMKYAGRAVGLPRMRRCNTITTCTERRNDEARLRRHRVLPCPDSGSPLEQAGSRSS